MKTALLPLAAAIAFAAVNPLTAMATSETGWSDAVAQADAIVHGVVRSVDYRMSESNEDGERLPHAFVTYDVKESLHGGVAGESVTLRFIGGPDGQGRFLTVDGVPLFDVGDEDVLLIRGNGLSDCPLVDCDHGRLRIHGGQIYTAQGLPVTGIERDQLRHGTAAEPALLTTSFPAPSFDDLLKNPEVSQAISAMADSVSLDELRRQYEAEAPKRIEVATVVAESADASISVVAGAGVHAVSNVAERADQQAPIGVALLRQLVLSATRDLDRIAGADVPSLDSQAPFRAASSAMVTAPPADDRRALERIDVTDPEPTN